MSDIGERMVPPDWSYMPKLWRPVWDTLNIATIGTAIAMCLAVPIAFLAAHNTTPHKSVRAVMLFIIVATRSVNSLIWALLLVVIVGPGVLAGTIAIGIRSIGGCAKLYMNLLKRLTQNKSKRLKPLVVPRTANGLRHFTPGLAYNRGVGVFRWDINVRGSTILGIVGAGGIGIQLSASINVLAWTQVTTILIVILGTVFVSEYISAKVRGAII